MKQETAEELVKQTLDSMETKHTVSHYYTDSIYLKTEMDYLLEFIARYQIAERAARQISQQITYQGRKNSMQKHLLNLGVDEYIKRDLIKLPAYNNRQLPTSIYNRIDRETIEWAVEKAYKERMQIYHPDANIGSKRHKHFTEITKGLTCSYFWVKKNYYKFEGVGYEDVMQRVDR